MIDWGWIDNVTLIFYREKKKRKGNIRRGEAIDIGLLVKLRLEGIRIVV